MYVGTAFMKRNFNLFQFIVLLTQKDVRSPLYTRGYPFAAPAAAPALTPLGGDGAHAHEAELLVKELGFFCVWDSLRG